MYVCIVLDTMALELKLRAVMTFSHYFQIMCYLGTWENALD